MPLNQKAARCLVMISNDTEHLYLCGDVGEKFCDGRMPSLEPFLQY